MEEENQKLNQQPAKKQRIGCWVSLAGCTGALFGAIVGSVVIVLLLLSLLNINPIDLLTGQVFSRPSTQKIKVESYYKDPVVAVAKKVEPSVVSLRVEKVQVLEDFESFFFGSPVQRVQGIGSGVIFRSDGLIITNSHVVEGADKIIVTFFNGKEVKGEVVGRDSENDIAVVKVDEINLPEAEFGSIKDVEVGELVVAIGSPLGFDYTVTAGVVSALNRTVTAADESGSPRTFIDLIQTDAPINPGNSGGALCDGEGKVIGINTLIATRSRGYQGIGFAIPIDTAIDVAEQLLVKGRVEHPFLGISGTDLTEEMAQERRLSVTEGAIVVQVIPGTPADQAGMKRGDVIVSFDDKSIGSMDELLREVRRHRVGDEVKIGVIRDSRKLTFLVKLAEKTQFDLR
jgi:S1-C subfamily serine protease